MHGPGHGGHGMGRGMQGGMHGNMHGEGPGGHGMHHGGGPGGGMGRMGPRTEEQEAAYLNSGGDVGDVDYPLFLINGRSPADPETLKVSPGDKVRIRFINASGDTIYKTALGGHRMTVTHVDGHPVNPREIDSFFISPGERADVEIIAADGTFPLVAEALGKGDRAVALLKSGNAGGSGDVRASSKNIPELKATGTLLHHFSPAERAMLPAGEPTRRQNVALTGDMMNYNWGMRVDGRSEPGTVREGERLRMRMTNHTMMPHPMHIHGHTWAMPGRDGLRKDTILVLPMQTVEADLIADNPGRWAFHCHNAYHLDVGMHTFLHYE